jgi:uncharacterized membrane protein (TIGR02234 family)
VAARDRWFLPVVGLGLATATLGVVAAGRDWATASTQAPGAREVAASGADVAPLVMPLSLIGLASWGAFLVLRTAGRRVVCAVGLLATVGAVAAVAVNLPDAGGVAAELLSDTDAATTSTTAWPWVAAVALAVCAATFVPAAARCPRWPQMSRRYDRDATGHAATERAASGGTQPADLWRALDDGRDPTL